MTLWTLLPVGSWLLILTVLVLDLTGVLHRGTGFRWQAIGVLTMNTAVAVSALAHHYGRTHSQILALDRATLALIPAGFAITMVGLWIQPRSRQKARRAG
jgi:hypothetical protein